MEHCTQAWALVSRHGHLRVIVKLKSTQRRVTKIITGVKDYSNWERLEKLISTTFLEKN